MKTLQITFFLIIGLGLIGCGQETKLSDDFYFPRGTVVTFSTDFSTTYEYNTIRFNLRDIPNSKTSRDFSDYLEVILTDGENNHYKPQFIKDINGLRKHIDASCDNIPRFTKLTKVKVTAKKDIQGESILWISGTGI